MNIVLGLIVEWPVMGWTILLDSLLRGPFPHLVVIYSGYPIRLDIKCSRSIRKRAVTFLVYTQTNGFNYNTYMCIELFIL